jgi:hypothetical protein
MFKVTPNPPETDSPDMVAEITANRVLDKVEPSM